jgi:hypothetical protein
MEVVIKPAELKAPFPAFGGKRQVAADIWRRLGDVDNYLEPFAFSAAVLLARPHDPKVETINDVNMFVSNFWRAVQVEPDQVAFHADWPVSEIDMHSRHQWLMRSGAAQEFRERMKSTPDYFDAKIAGWWCWGLCCWIGSGWCDEVGNSAESAKRPFIGNTGGLGVNQGRVQPALSTKRPSIGHPTGRGVNRGRVQPALSTKRPHIGDPTGIGVNRGRVQLADAFARGRGVHGNDAAETCQARREWLTDWMRRLADRLRAVRVCYGDWSRICSSPSTTTRLGTTGIFLDPPYALDLTRLHAWIRHLDGEGPEPGSRGTATNRDGSLYGSDGDDVDRMVADVHRYCREYGANPDIRIVLAGYEGEHDALESLGWSVVAWNGSGYGHSDQGKANAAKERLWSSPHCIDPDKELLPLFAFANL